MTTFRSRLVLTGLLALCVVPVAAGTARLVQLATGAVVTPENARFFASPVPVVVHVVTVTVFAVLGAVQVLGPRPGRRVGGRAWHRRTGPVIWFCGLGAALSGLWMTVFYALPPSDDRILMGFRLVVGAVMTAALVLGLRAVRRRELVTHGEWMLRAYALGMGAGTQVLTNVPWVLVAGQPPHTVRAFLMGAGWAVNAVLAELLIRRRRSAALRQGREDRRPVLAQ